jgi:hypothetical protein
MTTPTKEDAHKAEPHKAAAKPAAQTKEDKAKTDAAHLLGLKTDEERRNEALATDTRQADTDKVIADRKAAAEARGEKTDDLGFPIAQAAGDPEINPLGVPQVTPITETQPHMGGFLISEARGHRSRHQGVVASGSGKVLAGTVMGQITASKKFKPLDPAAVDGSQTGGGILYGDVDATSADKQAAFIVRDAEVNLGELVWGAGVTTQAQKDAVFVTFNAVSLIGRTGL